MNTPSERTNALERDLLTLAVNKPEASEAVAAIAPSSWQNPSHARIAQAIKELLSRGEAVGVGSVGNELGDHGIRNYFSDWATFTDCLSSKNYALPASALRTMIEAEAAKRKLQHGLNDGQRMLSEGHHPKDVAERITQALPVDDTAQDDENYQPFPVEALPLALRTFVNEGVGCWL